MLRAGAHDPAGHHPVDGGGLELPSVGEDMLAPDDVGERLAQRQAAETAIALGALDPGPARQARGAPGRKPSPQAGWDGKSLPGIHDAVGIEARAGAGP